MAAGKAKQATSRPRLRERGRFVAASPKTATVETGPEKPLLPAQCRTYLRKTVAAAFPQIVAGFLKEAEKGGCAHLKMATETVASKAKDPGKPKGKGAALRMLEELRREQDAELEGEM